MEEDVLQMISGPVDEALFRETRASFNRGEFGDYGSPVCMFRLLKVRDGGER